MDIDFQIDARRLGDAIARAVEQQLVARRAGVPGIIEFPFGALTAPREQAVVDHLTVDSVRIARGLRGGGPPFNALPVDVTLALSGGTTSTLGGVAPTMVSVIASVFIARRSDLAAAGIAPVREDRMKRLRVRVTYTLAASIAGAQALLSYTLATLEIELTPNVWIDPATLPMGTLDPATLASMRAQLGSMPPTALDTSSISDLLGAGYQIYNVGLTVAQGALTVRFQVDRREMSAFEGPGFALETITAWTAFYGAGPENRLAGDDLGLFVDGRIFERASEARIRDGLAGNTQLVLHADHPPHAVWSVRDDTHGAVVTRFGAAAKGACKPWNTDIDVDLSTTMVIGMPRPGTLRLDVHLDFAPYAGEVFLCALGNAFLGAFAGFVIGGVFGNIPGAIVGAIIGFVVGFVATFAAAYTYRIPAGTSFGQLQPVMGSDRDFFMEISLAAGLGGGVGAPSFTGVRALPGGLLVRGSLGDLTARRAALTALALPAGFAWRAPYGCAIPGTEAVLHFGGQNTGDGPLYVITAQILSANAADYQRAGSRLAYPTSLVQPRGSFRADEIVTLDGAAALRASAPLPPFELLVQTNGGARIFTVSGLDASLSEETLSQFQQAQAIYCATRRLGQQRRLRFPPGGDDLRFARDLFPPKGDPAPDAVEWTVRARGIRPDVELRVIAENGELVTTLRADGAGAIDAKLFRTGKRAAEAISVEVADGADGKVHLADAKPEIVVGRARFAKTVELAPPGKLVGRSLKMVAGEPTLVCSTTRGVYTYALGDAFTPRLVSVKEADKLADATKLSAANGVTAIDESKGALHRFGVAIAGSEDGGALAVYALAGAEAF
jgi:hypothetical protein